MALVGSVFERKPDSSMFSPSPAKLNESATGFLRALHRSRSLCARKGGTQQESVIPSHAAIPAVVQQAPRMQGKEEPDTDDWRVRMSEEKLRCVAEEGDRSGRNPERTWGMFGCATSFHPNGFHFPRFVRGQTITGIFTDLTL